MNQSKLEWNTSSRRKAAKRGKTSEPQRITIDFGLTCYRTTKWGEFLSQSLKGGGHSKKLTFLSSPMLKLRFSFSTPRSFSLSSNRYPEEIRLVRSPIFDFGGRHFKLYLAARPCIFDVIPSDSKSAGRRKTLD